MKLGTSSAKFGRLVQYLNWVQPIGGLEISDSFLRFLKIDGVVLRQVSLRLPPGIVSGGMVKDQKNLAAALQQLHAKIGGQNLSVILTVGSGLVYTQVFDLPYQALAKIEEAARLNLQMISPLDFKSVYADWQIVSENFIDQGQLEILGAFLRADVADEFLNVVKTANFSVVALEFGSLSLARTVKQLVKNLPLAKPRIILFVTNEGIDFIILKEGNLYFHRFVGWPAKDADGRAILRGEFQKVINFYYSRWGDSKEPIFVVSPADVPLLRQVAEDLQMAVRPLPLTSGPIAQDQSAMVISGKPTSEFSAAWLSVMGAALRGLIPRAQDNLISLTNIGTEEEYYHSRVIYFVGMWQRIVTVAVVMLLLIQGSAWWFLSQIDQGLDQKIIAISQLPLPADITKLQDQVKSFNQQVAMALKAKDQSRKWGAVLERLLNAIGSNITLSRLHFAPDALAMELAGVGTSETEIINFKNRLLQDKQYFENVTLPLAQIVREGGKIRFEMSLKVKK